MIEVAEIQCQSVLTRSRISGIDYTICPYIGCAHQCLYCYVRFMGFVKWDWEKFLYAKINAPEVLKKQLLRVKDNSRISISTATDPYQPAEKRYAITRQILKELLPVKSSISILTKSSLVTRDIDILKDMWDTEVGFTITTIDDEKRAIFEPFASSIKERFLALEVLKKAGIKTYIFIGPILPYLTEQRLQGLIKRAKDCGVKRIVIDKLNYINRLRLQEKIKKDYPELALRYMNVSREYFDKIKDLIIRECRGYNIDYEVCF